MLAGEVAVVGGEDHVGAIELPLALERGDDPRNLPVDGEQRLEHPLLAGDDALGQPRDRLALAQEARLVGEVGLVEARHVWRLEPGEGAGILGRRGRRRVRGVEAEVEEERSV